MHIEEARQPITKLDEWRRLAPPRDPSEQWVDGRSAKEAAKAWLADLPNAPQEIGSLLSSYPDFGEVVLDYAEPEAQLRFDRHRNPRNADLVIWARDDRGPVAITVEAKADEKFSDLVAQALSNALETLVANPRSGTLPRIVDLGLSLFGTKMEEQDSITALRYQLMTAVAGTLAHAATLDSERAVLVVHEFVTAKTSQGKLDRNADDLARFFRRISGKNVSLLEKGKLYGPVNVPGEPLFDRVSCLYIGKAVRLLGTRSA